MMEMKILRRGPLTQNNKEIKAILKITIRDSLKIACDDGVFDHCYVLGIMHYRDGNIKEAKQLIQKACKGGVTHACSFLDR